MQLAPAASFFAVAVAVAVVVAVTVAVALAEAVAVDEGAGSLGADEAIAGALLDAVGAIVTVAVDDPWSHAIAHVAIAAA